MSVLRQPPQILSWDESIDFQTRNNCDSCCPLVVVPENSFVPFVLLTDSPSFEDTRVMNLDDTLNTTLSLSFVYYTDYETGLYINYYDGD